MYLNGLRYLQYLRSKSTKIHRLWSHFATSNVNKTPLKRSCRLRITLHLPDNDSAVPSSCDENRAITLLDKRGRVRVERGVRR